jgi:hypothetical protein
MTDKANDDDGVQLSCIYCSGTVRAFQSGQLWHSMPTCSQYDRVLSLSDAAEFLREHRLFYSNKS